MYKEAGPRSKKPVHPGRHLAFDRSGVRTFATQLPASFRRLRYATPRLRKCTRTHLSGKTLAPPLIHGPSYYSFSGSNHLSKLSIPCRSSLRFGKERVKVPLPFRRGMLSPTKVLAAPPLGGRALPYSTLRIDTRRRWWPGSAQVYLESAVRCGLPGLTLVGPRDLERIAKPLCRALEEIAT